MTREEALNKAIGVLTYHQVNSCKSKEAVANINEIIEALEKIDQEPCEDCISRDKAIVQLNHLLSNFDDEGNLAIRKCIETIKSMSPVTPQPKMGKWLIKRAGDYNHAICSVCGDDSFLSPEWDALELYKYCPNCGAKMQEVEE